MANIGASSYEDKLERLDKCTRLEKPDRVPIGVATLYFPAKYSGISYEQMYYDQGKYLGAAKKFARDFNWDAACFLRSFESVTLGLSLAGTDPATAINVAVASVLGGGFSHDILKDIYSSQPGREIDADNESQFKIKQPVMSVEEYDEFIEDPFGFLGNKVVPRVYGALSKPGSAEAATALVNLGMKLNTALGELQQFAQEMKTVCCPPWYMALAPNPLDTLGAFIRDFDKVLMDIHRVPSKVKKICETLAPVLAAVGKATGEISYQLTGSRRVFCPVWYNSFLSKKEYREFHWPYLKYICEELIKADFVPLLSLQGTYDHLLDTLLELPEGKAIAWFDRTDPVKAKEVIGDHLCIAGGISPALLIGGTPEETDGRVKTLLDDMKTARGFIFTLPFNAIGPAKTENIIAMTDAVHKYGAY
jgi:uroporphyrinogen-III decarboxylase